VVFNYSRLLAALALVLVLEGILPFASPAAMKRLAARMQSIGDRELRIAGLSSMLAGVALLFLFG